MLTGRQQRYLTYGIVAVITLACLCMAGPMRAGFPVGNELPDRMAFIAEHAGLWKAG